MNFLFAWRYFKAPKSINAINIIAWISVIAIIIGTWALITVLSVFNGFEGLVKSLYSSFYTDIRISSQQGKSITVSQEQLTRLQKISSIKTYSLVVEEKALLQNAEYQSMVNLKGVDTHYKQITNVSENLVGNGSYDIGTINNPRLILGVGVENALGVRADLPLEPLHIYLPRAGNKEQLNWQEDISKDTISTAGAFAIQQDFDNQYAITNIAFVKKALQWDANKFTQIEIMLQNPDEEKEVILALKKDFAEGYSIQNKYQQNQNLYSVMNMEKWVIYGVLSLILIVAAFNMIGALTMLVLEKRKDIAVLHALGAGKTFIRKIFLSEGLLIAILGGGIGVALALLTIFLQTTFHIIPITGGSFLINYIPVQLKLKDILLVAATVLVIAVLASLIPATKAAQHIRSLRTE